MKSVLGGSSNQHLLLQPMIIVATWPVHSASCCCRWSWYHIWYCNIWVQNHASSGSQDGPLDLCSWVCCGAGSCYCYRCSFQIRPARFLYPGLSSIALLHLCLALCSWIKAVVTHRVAFPVLCLAPCCMCSIMAAIHSSTSAYLCPCVSQQFSACGLLLACANNRLGFADTDG